MYYKIRGKNVKFVAFINKKKLPLILLSILCITLSFVKFENINPQTLISLEGVERDSQQQKRDLTNLFTSICWIAYTPTVFNPMKNPIIMPSEEDVRKDLEVLRQHGFEGIVTYSSNFINPDTKEVLDIPKLAKEAGFSKMIVGVWDLEDEDELQAAESFSNNEIVVGYIIGNEGLDVRYNLETLSKVITRFKKNTGKLVSTTEQAHDYYENSPLWQLGDFISMNVHPYFANIKEPEKAVEWTLQIYNNLLPIANKNNKILLFKEVGLPSSDGSGNVSEIKQARYYDLLNKYNINYIVFEAFDMTWKHLPKYQETGIDPEPHWGVFRSDRSNKKAVKNICS